MSTTPAAASTSWATKGADVVFFRRTSKGVIDNVNRARIASARPTKINVTNLGGAFSLDSRLSHGWPGERRSPLYRKADGWGGRWIVAPVGHPILDELGIDATDER